MDDVTSKAFASSAAAQEGLAAAAGRLLEATEAIHAALLGGGDVDALEHFYRQREAAYAVLVEAESARGREGLRHAFGPAGRAAIVRVRALDEEILSLGGHRVEALRDERHQLRRRRAAIERHGRREREAPRVVTVKV